MKITGIIISTPDPGTLAADHGMEQCVYRTDDGKTLNCCRRKMNYDLPGKAAVLLFLHGAGERGNDNSLQLFHGAKEVISWCSRNKQKVLLLFPQCPKNIQWVATPWSDLSHTLPEISEPLSLALAALDHEVAAGKDDIDTSRIYVSGISMGGYGTWDVLSRYPEKIAAAFPICGGADITMAEKMKNVPILTFHGSEDKTVPVSRTRDMVEALRKAGAKITYVELQGCDHNSWTPAFADDKNWAWLFEQSK